MLPVGLVADGQLRCVKQQMTAAVITVTTEMDKINYQLDIMLRKKCTWKFTDKLF